MYYYTGQMGPLNIVLRERERGGGGGGRPVLDSFFADPSLIVCLRKWLNGWSGRGEGTH